MRIYLVHLLIVTSLVGCIVQAQEENIDDQEIINIENLYKNNPPPAVQQPRETVKSVVGQKNATANTEKAANGEIEKLTDLNKLSPFSDISVIQKKFLPKTKRFQLYTAGGLMTNSPWFINIGVKANLAYHFSENFGVEASGMILTNSESDAAKEIRDNNSLQPSKFVITKYNMLLDLMWSPIYGKMTTLDNIIIPFDMYFTLGGGLSGTNSQEGNVPTFHIGTGQIFALSKSTAFRWDYSWNFYQATPEADSASTSAPSKSSYNDLIFTAGVSFFFPEVSDR